MATRGEVSGEASANRGYLNGAWTRNPIRRQATVPGTKLSGFQTVLQCAFLRSTVTLGHQSGRSTKGIRMCFDGQFNRLGIAAPERNHTGHVRRLTSREDNFIPAPKPIMRQP